MSTPSGIDEFPARIADDYLGLAMEASSALLPELVR